MRVMPRRLACPRSRRRKGPVADDRPADRESRLYALILGIGLSLRREVVRRVERAVSDERIGGALKLVGARLHHDADLRCRLASVRGFGRAREHLELLNRIDRRPHTSGVQLRIDVVGAIEQEAVEIFAAAVDAEREVTAHRPCGSLRRGHGAWREQRELEEIPAVERHVEDLPVLDNCADGGRVAPHIGNRRRDLDAIGQRTELQLRVRAPLLIDDEHDTLHVRLMPRRANFDTPRTGRAPRARTHRHRRSPSCVFRWSPRSRH